VQKDFCNNIGEALAISIPRAEAAVIRHFRLRLFVPEVEADSA
jgi:hypothetical protein